VDAAERAVVRKKLRRRDLLAYMGKLPLALPRLKAGVAWPG
jgi:hypothetical protein